MPEQQLNLNGGDPRHDAPTPGSRAAMVEEVGKLKTMNHALMIDLENAQAQNLAHMRRIKSLEKQMQRQHLGDPSQRHGGGGRPVLAREVQPPAGEDPDGRGSRESGAQDVGVPHRC